MLYDDGTKDILNIPPFITGSAGALQSSPPSNVATQDGWLVGFDVVSNTTGLSYGDTYVRAYVGPGAAVISNTDEAICADYLWDGNYPTMGVFVSRNPPSLAAPSVLLDTGNTAGNAGATGSSVAGATGVWEVDAFVYSYTADAVVNARTTAAAKIRGLYQAFFESGVPFVAGDTQNDYVSPTLAFAAGQGGYVELTAGGVERANANGTITLATGKLSFPLTIVNPSLVTIVIAAATNGDVGDSHRAQLIGRRIA